MSEPKTKPSGQSVEAFIDAVDDEKKRQDCDTILRLMQEITGEQPVLWGDSIVGFGSYRYRYASGREGEWPLTGFAPRKRNITLYIMSGFSEYDSLLEKLGKFKIDKSCLYINKIEDVDQGALRELVRLSVDHMKKTNP